MKTTGGGDDGEVHPKKNAEDEAEPNPKCLAES